MDELNKDVAQSADIPPVESPPVAPRSEVTALDPRASLFRLANELSRSRNARLLVEYLRLRRAMQ